MAEKPIVDIYTQRFVDEAIPSEPSLLRVIVPMEPGKALTGPVQHTIYNFPSVDSLFSKQPPVNGLASCADVAVDISPAPSANGETCSPLPVLLFNPKTSGGKTQPLSSGRLADFMKRMGDEATAGLPGVDPALHKTQELDLSWLNAYAQEIEEKEGPIKERPSMADVGVVFSPLDLANAKSDELVGLRDKINKMCEAVFADPYFVRLQKGLTIDTIRGLFKERVSIILIHGIGLEKAEKMAQVIRNVNISAAMVFLHTDKDAEKDGKKWPAKIRALIEDYKFDNVITLGDNECDAAKALYSAKSRHLREWRYTNTLGVENVSSIKEKIRIFYDMFSESVSRWGTVVSDLKLSEKDEDTRSNFLETLRGFYFYLHRLYHYGCEEYRGPSDLLFLLNILNKKMGIILNSPVILEDSARINGGAKDVKIIKKETAVLGKSIKALMVYLYKMDDEARSKMKRPVKPPQEPIEESGPAQIAPEDLEYIGPPEKAVLIIKTEPLYKVQPFESGGGEIELDAGDADTTGLELDLGLEDAQRLGLERHLGPIKIPKYKRLAETSQKKRREFLDYALKFLHSGAGRIKTTMSRLGEVDSEKTRIELVIIDAQHPFEDMDDAIRLFKARLGGEVPVILIAPKELDKHISQQGQIAKLLRDDVVTLKIPDLSSENFIALVKALIASTTKALDAIEVPRPKGGVQPVRLRQFRDEYSAIADSWVSLVKQIGSSTNKRAPILLFPGARNWENSPVIIKECFNELGAALDEGSSPEQLASLKRMHVQLCNFMGLLLAYHRTDVDVTGAEFATLPDVLKSVSDLKEKVVLFIKAFYGIVDYAEPAVTKE